MRSEEDQLPRTREKILRQAITCVIGDREQDYGGPEDSFASIASFWNAYLGMRPNPGTPIDAYDVGAMMVLFKVARMAKRPSNLDSCIDAAGYSACAGEIFERMNGVNERVPEAFRDLASPPPASDPVHAPAAASIPPLAGPPTPAVPQPTSTTTGTSRAPFDSCPDHAMLRDLDWDKEPGASFDGSRYRKD